MCDLRIREHSSMNLSRQRRTDSFIVDDAFFRHPDGCDARYVRLNLSHLLDPQHLEAHQSILLAAIEKIVKPRKFLLFGSYNQLSAYLVVNGVLAAELNHLPDAAYGETRFRRAGLVIDARVQNAAVVP